MASSPSPNDSSSVVAPMTKVLIPGSFDPLHLGHIDVVDQAVEYFNKFVDIGSMQTD